jgi:hypothetical protein
MRAARLGSAPALRVMAMSQGIGRLVAPVPWLAPHMNGSPMHRLANRMRVEGQLSEGKQA